MRLFDTPGADDSYDRMLEPPEQHDECGCPEICHAAHLECFEFGTGCERCLSEMTLEAVWCVDSESGVETLLRVPNGEVLARRFAGKIVEPGTL